RPAVRVVVRVRDRGRHPRDPAPGAGAPDRSRDGPRRKRSGLVAPVVFLYAPDERLKMCLTVAGSDRTLTYTAYAAKSQAMRRQLTRGSPSRRPLREFLRRSSRAPRRSDEETEEETGVSATSGFHATVAPRHPRVFGERIRARRFRCVSCRDAPQPSRHTRAAHLIGRMPLAFHLH